MPHLLVAGQQVHYVRRVPAPANQPSLLFIHGAGGSHQHWLNEVQELTRGSPTLPLYAPDLPGHGLSDGPGRDSIQSYANLLVGFLDAAALDQVVLVGHSMGGAIALEVAINHPERVVALGLVATGAQLRVAPVILDSIRQDSDRAVRLICEKAYRPDAAPEVLRTSQRQMSAIPSEVLYGDFVACDRFDAVSRLAAIQVPVLVLCGTRDQLTPPRFSTYLRDHIGGAQLHMIEGAGHMPMIEQPEAVAQALRGFLAGLQSTEKCPTAAPPA